MSNVTRIERNFPNRYQPPDLFFFNAKTYILFVAEVCSSCRQLQEFEHGRTVAVERETTATILPQKKKYEEIRFHYKKRKKELRSFLDLISFSKDRETAQK